MESPMKQKTIASDLGSIPHISEGDSEKVNGLEEQKLETLNVHNRLNLTAQVIDEQPLEQAKISTRRVEEKETLKSMTVGENEIVNKLKQWDKIKQQSQAGKNKKTEFDKEIFAVLAGKSSELQWFMFESRVRTLVMDLTSPI